MLSVHPAPMPDQVVPSSGSAKRARRAELPQPFIMVTHSGQGQYKAYGVAVVCACETYSAREQLQSEFDQLVQRTHRISPANFVTWSVGQRCLFANGPVHLLPADVQLPGWLVGEVLTPPGHQRMSQAALVVGSDRPLVCQLFGANRLRLWRLPLDMQVASIFDDRAFFFVTGRQHAFQAGVPVSEHTGTATPDANALEVVLPADLPAEPEARPHSYEFDIMVAAMRLSNLLKNPEHMTEAVKSALLTAGGDLGRQIGKDIDAGRILVPQKDALRNGWVKLDCAAVLWDRARAQKGKTFRFLMADSSLKLYNYLCTRERSFRPCRAGDERTRVWWHCDVGTSFENHAWQCTVLGYGASNVAYKARNIVHTALLQCDGEEEWQDFRRSIIGWTSDQGTERKIADCACTADAGLVSLAEIVSKSNKTSLALDRKLLLVCIFGQTVYICQAICTYCTMVLRRQ